MKEGTVRTGDLCLLQVADLGLEQGDLLRPALPVTPSIYHFAKGGLLPDLSH